jgi:hypothetical protein
MIKKKHSIKLLPFVCGTIISNGFLINQAQAGQIDNLRNQRYCEIILSSSLKSIRHVSVYNTIGLNECPDNLWNTITTSSIKAETGAKFVHLNGPRHWVIDGMTGSTKLVNKTPHKFGGIAMREAATINLSWSDLLFGSTPYKIHTINRNTVYTYKAHKPIYELINPQGERFIMQSYSDQKMKQTESSLNGLATQLTLPKGWSFHSHILNKDTYLSTVNHQAKLTQDNLLNSYQQETVSFAN